jgi:hypothetical protein
MERPLYIPRVTRFFALCALALLAAFPATAKPHIGTGISHPPAATRPMAIGNNVLLGIGTGTAPSNTYTVSRKQICTAHWGNGITGLALGFNGYTVNTGAQDPAEIPLPNNYIVRLVSVEYGSPPYATFTFAGKTSSSATVTGGSFTTLTDVLPVSIPDDTCFFVRVELQQINPGDLFAVTATWSVNGEGETSSATNLDSIVTGGGGTFGTASMFGPAMVFATGWDGVTPVELTVGDSICQQFNDYAPDARGSAGYVRRMMDDNTVSTRMGVLNFCISGTAPGRDYQTDLGHYGYRLGTLGVLQAAFGAYPFTGIFSEMGVNSVADGATQFPIDMQLWWQMLQTNIPGNQIVQATLTPNTGGGSADGYSTSQGVYLSPSVTASSGATSLTFSTLTSGGTTVQPGWWVYNNNGVGFQTYITAISGSGPYTVTLSAATTATITAGTGFVSMGSQLVNSGFSDCNNAVGVRCTENFTIIANAAPYMFNANLNLTSSQWKSWNTGIIPINSYWPAPANSGTLTQAVVGGTTKTFTANFTNPPQVGDFMVFEPGWWVQTTAAANGSMGDTTIQVQQTVQSTPASGAGSSISAQPGWWVYDSAGALPITTITAVVPGTSITVAGAGLTGPINTSDKIYMGAQEPVRPFTTSSNSANQITAVSGTGPYTITLNNPAIVSHSSGKTLATAWVSDAVHPSGSLAETIALQGAALKSVFTFAPQ